MAIADAYRRETGRMPHAPTRQAGNWKLAYADFLTALVALFLVFWLVNDRPDGDKAALAGYFRGDTDTRALQGDPLHSSQSHRIADTLNRTVLLERFRPNLIATAEHNRVRISLMDGSLKPMFETGQATFSPTGNDALRSIAGVLQQLEGRLEIEGHTDAFPYTGTNTDNWTLSVERADSARRALIAAGIDPGRIGQVAGFGDTRPLRAEEPHRAENRRVTIVLQVTE